MAPSANPLENGSATNDSDAPSESAAGDREAQKNEGPRKSRSDRSELYRRMKRVDPGLAHKYRQLEGQ